MGKNVETFYFPEAGGFGGNGVSDVLLGSMLGGNGGGFGGNGMWNNPIWAIVFLAALRNGGIFGNNGWDGNGAHPCTTSQLTAIQETLNSNHGQTLLMDAIKGNASAVHELATTIGCNHNAVQSAINGVQSAICNLGNQSNMNAMQVVNAIQSGNTALANQLSQCCCDNKLLTTQQGYENRINNMQQSQMIQSGFTSMGYANAENTAKVIAKLDQIEDSRKDREINTLTAQLATVNARAERQAELAPLFKAVNDIQCKLPQTYNVPYQPFTAIPNCVAYQAFGYPYGLNNYNNGQWS